MGRPQPATCCPIGPRCESDGREVEPETGLTLSARVVPAQLDGEHVEICMTLCSMCYGAPDTAARWLRRSTIAVLAVAHKRHVNGHHDDTRDPVEAVSTR